MACFRIELNLKEDGQPILVSFNGVVVPSG